MDAAPVAALALSVASAALFALVGRTMQRRRVSPEGRSAQLGFVAWWYGIAGVSIVGAAMAFPGFPLDVGLFLVVAFLLIGVLCAALAGLLHYLVFLYTSRNALGAIVAAYVAFFVLLIVFIGLNEPTGLQETRWGPELDYANPIDGGPLYWTVVLALIAPPVVAALAYFTLYWKARDPVLKRRILLVSLSIAVWFGSSLVGMAPGARDTDWWILTSRVIGLAAAATILYAYAGLKPSVPDQPSPAAATEDSIYEGPRREVASVAPASLAALV